ncbi:hypothetical protein AM587_10011753 [Phytophthora nicotianae]|uniref:Uncharacterized protein n=1 Tax=Phytophthora nicotianae TaxID=4792 RepID=A0A0W8C0P1_PHYNI|nr:hypothetical protein AM587_10011753 [Phytophthora nicotianae]
MPQNMVAPPLFSEAELLDVLTGIDADSVRDEAPGPSVNVVLSEDVLSSEQAFEDFMDSFGSGDDVGVLRASDGSQSESTSSTSSLPALATKSKRKVGATACTEMPAPSGVKPKRKRRKHELDHLRAVAVELEKKLHMLNRASNEEQPDANHTWKHISNQLMTERQRAVGENARLRQLVREQVKSVKAMQRALDKTPDLSALQNQGNEMFGHCTVTNPSGSRQSLGNIAVRRYYESNKLKFVWECDGLCSHDDISMRVHQKGWCVFEPAEEDPQNATIFRACVRMSPTLADSSDPFIDSAKAVGQTTEIVIENYEKTVLYIFDAVLDSLAGKVV